MVAQSHRDHVWCRAHLLPEDRTKRATMSTNISSSLCGAHRRQGEKVVGTQQETCLPEKINEWKEVNNILILTNIAITTAGAAVCDHCRSRLAIAAYRNCLRKDIKIGMFQFKELHTLPQYCLPKFVERATIASALELVLPQLPRPGSK